MVSEERIQVSVHHPYVLQGNHQLWMVMSGSANVFCVQMDENGSFLSPLTYLYTVQKGELLFSLLPKENQENTRLIIYSDQSTLLPIQKHDVLKIDHFFLKQMLEKWIIKTAQILSNESVPRIYKPLEVFGNQTLRKNKIAFPPHGIAWCYFVKGELEAYSENIKIGEKVPRFPIVVSKNLWLKSLTESSIRILGTSKILEDEIDLMLSLNHLQDHFYKKLVNKIENEQSDEESSIQEKLENEEKSLKNTLEKIKGIVSINKSDDFVKDSFSKNNTLLRTCKIIGDKIGIDIQSPKYIESYNNNTSNQIYTIAQSSKIRIRKVILRGAWWKEENGHLLAFDEKTKKPVALIQKTSKSYELIDIENETKKKVDYKVAEKLEPIAYMFLPGFNTSLNSIRKIAGFAMRGLQKDAKLLLLAALAGSLIGLLVPILSGIMFDDVIPTADRSLLFEVLIIMVMIAIVTAGLQLVQGALQLRVESKSSVNLQAGVMDHLLRLPVTFYNNYSAGDLTNRALSINAIRQIMSSTLMTAVLSGAFTFVNLILLFHYHSKLAWVGVALAAVAVVFMLIMGRIKLSFDRKVSDQQGDLQGFLFEFLSGINKIRITGAEKRIFALWADKFSKYKKLGFQSGSYQNFVEVFNSSYPLLTNMFFFGFIYYTIQHSGKMTSMLSVGAFMAFITAFNQFLRDCLRMSLAFITSLNVITLYERVKPILEKEPESTEQSVDPGELSGDIEMNSVNFRYDEDQPLVLKNVSFHIKPGEMVAFVGPSGSGKSTIMRLLLGFEHPETGSIYYDEDAFDSMNKDLVRKQMGVVLQNGALMSGSIYKNIVGNSELTLEDAWEAAKMAGMEEDIKQMPMEMHTVVSEGAGTFSGGQKQRLMIARAIVHKPRILFMDEATSALDNRTQNIVAESLDKLQATRIVIAHRLSTVKNADKIFVLDKGEIIEQGTYNELMAKRGLFSELAKRQIA